MKKRKLKKVTARSRPARRKHVHKGIFCDCRGGISPKVIIIGGVIVLALAAGGYFMFANNISSPGGIVEKVGNAVNKTALQKITEESLKYIKDPILRKHYTAEANAAKRRMKMPQGMEAGATQVIEMEMIGGGASILDFKANQSMWTDQKGTKKSEYIVIGDTTYVKDYTDNKWWKQTKTEEKIKEDNSFAKEIEDSIKPETIPTGPEPVEPKKVGEEKCPNVPSLTCYKYEDNDPTFTRTFWFDNQQYLLRKDVSGSGENSSWTEYEYDNINISAPSPTKDVPVGRNIYEYLINSMQGSTGEPQEMPNIEELKSQMQNYQPPAETYDQPEQPDYSGEIPPEESY